MTITLQERDLLDVLNLTRGAPLGGDLVFDRVVPHHEGGLLLSWRQRGARRMVSLQVRERDDALPAWRRTASLDLITRLPGDLEAGPVLASLEPLVERLRALGEGVTLASPVAFTPAPPPRRIDLPAERCSRAPSPFTLGRVFVLDLQSDCHQSCSFCSTRAKWSPVREVPSDELVRIEAGLREARAQGYDVLRLSGLDPLWHPHVFDAIDAAASLDYEHLHIYSPSTRYGEPGVLDELLRACGPMERTYYVPLYGPTARLHDAVTGTPGSFERVLDAARLLVQRGQGDRIVWVTVLTSDNLDRWPETRARMFPPTAPVQVFLPFPSTRASDDAFFTTATTHEAALRALMAAPAPVEGLAEILPCVRYRYERDHGAPALTAGAFHPVTALLGTLFEHADYRRLDDGEEGNTFTIPTRACAHHTDCALAPLCPQGVYDAYATRFGLDELEPVSAAALEELGFTL